MYTLVLKDAVWQIIWRVVSALAWFIVLIMITPYLWPLRYWDYGTILAYFAFISSLADLWLYSLWLQQLGKWTHWDTSIEEKEILYSKIVFSRRLLIGCIYLLSLAIVYLFPAYRENAYLLWWFPLWMIFSAIFMAAWIVQLPLQIWWKMHHVSISLIIARIVQIVLLALFVFVLSPLWTRDGEIPVTYFLAVFFTVCISSIVQFAYTLYFASKELRIRFVSFLSFAKDMLIDNRKYWVGFFMSSAPALYVVLLLSILYPTIDWFTYTWIRWLSLQIYVILLVIPPALWNSLLHKVVWYAPDRINSIMRSFISLLCIGGIVIFLNFILFAPNIISLLWADAFLSSTTLWQDPLSRFSWEQKLWSDIWLVFLWFVTILNFLKQWMTYTLLANSKQNDLFATNWLVVLITLFLTYFFIDSYWLLWGMLAQVFIELCFVIAIMIPIYRYWYTVLYTRYSLIYITILLSLWVFCIKYFYGSVYSFYGFIWLCLLFNLFAILVSIKYITFNAKNLV